MPGVLPRHAAATLVEPGGRGSVATVRFNNEGKYLVSGGSDRRLRLWSAASGGLAKAYAGHTAGIHDATFSSANDRIASGGAERLVYLWDVSRDEPTARLRGHQDAVSAVRFTAGDAVLVSGSHDATVKFWDLRALRSGTPLQTLTAATDAVVDIEVRDTLVHTASLDGFLRTYDIRKGTLVEDCLGVPLCSFAVSGDGRLNLVAGADDGLRLFDASSGCLLKNFAGYDAAGCAIQCAFAPSGDYVFSGSLSGEIVFWNLLSGMQCLTLTCGEGKSVVPAVDHNPHESMVAAGCSDGAVRIFSTPSQ